MASLIQGFEYDIFISYRQKDNKGDKWVSKFVDALKTELESTFKEDISVYFDENPHDRLQETHNVDKSLEGKLKCLIFIPILSQTYCDPNSYAWQNEFLAFLKLANQDSFGKDIKLRSGNVASRILPIRIHDLEPDDIKLFEKETGSVLRAMDFVFKTATGVSRPLKDNEDHPQDNLNKTFYSDQINKVGHAIKEVIRGMKKEPEPVIKEKPNNVLLEEPKIIQKNPAKAGYRKIIPFVAVAALILIAAVFVYTKIFKTDTLDKLQSSGEKNSIVVMPFQNNTNDTLLNVWQVGIQEIIITSLSNTEDLKVRQTESITSLLQSKGLTNYASLTPSVASSISQKLDANILICGSIKQAGKTLRLNAQLIDPYNEEVFKSFQIDGNSDNLLPTFDSLSVMIRDFLIVSKLVKQISRDMRSAMSTKSPDAFKYYIYGNNALQKQDNTSARDWYLKSLNADSTFFTASYFLVGTYMNQGMYDKAKQWCLRYYKKKDLMSVKDQIRLNATYSALFETPYEVIKYCKQLIDLDNKDVINLYLLGLNYNNIFQYDNAIPQFEKVLEIYNEWDSKPFWAYMYTVLGYAYHKTGQYDKEKRLYEKANQDFPNDPSIIYRQSILSLTEKDTITANQYINKFLSILKDRSASEAVIDVNLASIYSEAGILDKAEKYHRRALSLEPKRAVRLNNLAWFLIDNDRNINEGLELVDRALKQSPENYTYLDTKGWGLYKQGKYNEALEILQKNWDLIREKAVYDHEAFLHLEAAKKAVAGLK